MSLRKRVRIGKYAVPVLLLLTIAVGTVSALAYVVLTWTVSMTVADHPRVAFWDGSNVENTMDVSLNIFPSIRTIDENHDVWDIRANATGNIYIEVSALDNTDVTEVRIKAYNATHDLFDETWTDAAAGWKGPFTTAASDYDLWIEVLAAATATDPAEITVKMRVENP